MRKQTGLNGPEKREEANLWAVCRKVRMSHSRPKVPVWIAMILASAFLHYVFLFFFFLVQPAIVNFVNYEQCIRALFTIPQITFSATFLLKMGLIALFTHLKIILLQCFQFQFSILAKINLIQTYQK